MIKICTGVFAESGFIESDTYIHTYIHIYIQKFKKLISLIKSGKNGPHRTDKTANIFFVLF